MQHLAMSHWHDNLWQFHDHKINDVLLLGPGNFIRLRLKTGFLLRPLTMLICSMMSAIRSAPAELSEVTRQLVHLVTF